MRKALALVVACCAMAVTPFALAQTQGSSTTPPVSSSSCTPIKQVYSEKRWQEPKPARGENVCPVARKAGAHNTVEHFYLYRHYREITPYRCQSGSRGTWAIPCSIISCESGFSWMAANPSGAVGPYQLLGWGATYPARSFRDKLQNHVLAAQVYSGGSGRSNWVC